MTLNKVYINEDKTDLINYIFGIQENEMINLPLTDCYAYNVGVPLMDNNTQNDGDVIFDGEQCEVIMGSDTNSLSRNDAMILNRVYINDNKIELTDFMFRIENGKGGVILPITDCSAYYIGISLMDDKPKLCVSYTDYKQDTPSDSWPLATLGLQYKFYVPEYHLMSIQAEQIGDKIKLSVSMNNENHLEMLVYEHLEYTDIDLSKIHIGIWNENSMMIGKYLYVSGTPFNIDDDSDNDLKQCLQQSMTPTNSPSMEPTLLSPTLVAVNPTEAPSTVLEEEQESYLLYGILLTVSFTQQLNLSINDTIHIMDIIDDDISSFVINASFPTECDISIGNGTYDINSDNEHIFNITIFVCDTDQQEQLLSGIEVNNFQILSQMISHLEDIGITGTKQNTTTLSILSFIIDNNINDKEGRVSTTDGVLIVEEIENINNSEYFGVHGNKMRMVLLFIVASLAGTSIIAGCLIFCLHCYKRRLKRKANRRQMGSHIQNIQLNITQMDKDNDKDIDEEEDEYPEDNLSPRFQSLSHLSNPCTSAKPDDDKASIDIHRVSAGSHNYCQNCNHQRKLQDEEKERHKQREILDIEMDKMNENGTPIHKSLSHHSHKDKNGVNIRNFKIRDETIITLDQQTKGCDHEEAIPMSQVSTPKGAVIFNTGKALNHKTLPKFNHVSNSSQLRKKKEKIQPGSKDNDDDKLDIDKQNKSGHLQKCSIMGIMGEDTETMPQSSMTHSFPYDTSTADMDNESDLLEDIGDMICDINTDMGGTSSALFMNDVIEFSEGGFNDTMHRRNRGFSGKSGMGGYLGRKFFPISRQNTPSAFQWRSRAALTPLSSTDDISQHQNIIGSKWRLNNSSQHSNRDRHNKGKKIDNSEWCFSSDPPTPPMNSHFIASTVTTIVTNTDVSGDSDIIIVDDITPGLDETDSNEDIVNGSTNDRTCKHSLAIKKPTLTSPTANTIQTPSRTPQPKTPKYAMV